MKDNRPDKRLEEQTAPKDVRSSDQPVSEFEQLRQLLMHEELARVAALERRLTEPDHHAPLVGRDLPRAIRESGSSGKKLTRALGPTVEGILHNSVRNDPRTMADALYPVMGPSIRRSISEALRGMIQSFNEVLSNSFSWKGFKWRLEAMRTKRSFAEVVLLHSLVYRVEQCFLIHRDTGLVLQHLSAEAVEYQDADMVSGMLTAIQDFVQDSFSTGEQALESLQVGELHIIIEKGPQAVLALVVRGQPPVDLAEVTREALESIQEEMAGQLSGFNGDAAPFEAIRPILVECMRARYVEEKKASPLAFVVAALVIILLVGGGMYYLHLERVEKQRVWTNFITSLNATPGVVVTSETTQDDRYVVQGLRDPLAAMPEDVLRESKVNNWDVSLAFLPYQSLEPEFVLQRATIALNPPRGVSLSLQEGVLFVEGTGSKAWQERARSVVRSVAGLEKFDDRSFENKDQVVFERLAAGVESRWIQFGIGTEIIGDQEAVIREVASAVARLQELGVLLENEFSLIVNGVTDYAGKESYNSKLRLSRAEKVRALLEEAGVDPAIMSIRANRVLNVHAGLQSGERPRRRVEFTVSSISTTLSPLNLLGGNGEKP